MQMVTVSGSYRAVVDDEDYAVVAPYKWWVVRGGMNRYAATMIAGKQMLMHRLITGAATGTLIDHVDGDGLNNRRKNLRPCTHAQNLQNAGPRRTRGKTSRYKGVWLIKRGCQRCWRAGITANRVYRNLGSFWTEEEAARAYDAAAKLLHGEFARLNSPESLG